MNQPALSKSFEERMFDQIKSQMGDLLTAEELKKILETAIEKAFFSERKDGCGYHAKTIEPLFVEMIRKELSPLIRAGAERWLEDNKDRVEEILQQQLGENACQFVANAFASLMSEPMQRFSYELQSRLSGQGIHI